MTASKTCTAKVADTTNKYETGEYSRHWLTVKTPLATFTNGMQVFGQHDFDGSPFAVALETEHGHFCVTPSGIAGTWAGVDLELTPEQIARLQSLFMSNVLWELLSISETWTGQPCVPVAHNRSWEPILLVAKFWTLLFDLVGRDRMSHDLSYDLSHKIAVMVDEAFGLVESHDLPALVEIYDRRKAERGESDDDWDNENEDVEPSPAETAWQAASERYDNAAV